MYTAVEPCGCFGFCCKMTQKVLHMINQLQFGIKIYFKQTVTYVYVYVYVYVYIS